MRVSNDMAGLIDDDLLESIAVVGEPDTVAQLIRARLEGISDSVSLSTTGRPIPCTSPRSSPG
jgi:hypothetical protein